MKKRNLQIAIASLFLIGAAACGSADKKSEDGDDHEMHEEHGDMDHDMHEGGDEKATLLPIPENAKVMFSNLKEGDTISMPFTVQFAVEGMKVEPAGELHEGMGHHHLLLNRAFHKRGIVVPADSVNIHYGDGSIETELNLPAGNHMLTMQFADGYHQSYGEQMSYSVNVVVE